MIHVTDNNFDEKVLKSELPVLLVFWAPWCGACRSYSNVLEKVDRNYSDFIVVAKMNTDENKKSRDFNLSAIPTSIIFKNGEVSEKFTGLVSENGLKEKLDKIVDERVKK